MGTGETLGQGDERNGVSEGHFVEQFGSVLQKAEMNIGVEKNVLGEQVQRRAVLENVAVEALPCVGVAVSDGLLEHVGVGMGIHIQRSLVSKIEAWREIVGTTSLAV